MNKETLTAPALEALLQAPSLAVTAVDKQGCVILWSPSASRMFGWTESEALGHFLPIIPQDQRQEFLDRIENGIKGGTVIALEARRLRKDGTLIDVSLWTAPLKDSKGDIIGILGVHADVTARKQTEEALRESEARFRGIFAAAASGIVLVSPEGRFLHANPAFCEFLGYSEQELASKRVQDVTHPDDRERTAEVRRQIWKGETPLIRRYEKRYLRKDGKTVWGEVSISLIHDAMGNPNYSIAQVLDISARKQVEEALSESEERYRLMAEAIPQPVWRCNPQGERVESNRRWYEYTGQTFEQARGKGWMKALHPDDVGRVMQRLKDDVAGGEICQAEYRLRRASDGSYRWHMARALPVKDKNGRILCWFGSAVDIEDQKRTQEVLEERVRERTGELVKANEALRQSEAKYRTLVEEIPAITYIAALDEASTTLYVSPQVEQLLGLTLADYKANPHAIWRQHLHPDDRERVMAELRRTRTSHEPFDCEYRMLNRTGRILWFRDRALVVCDEEGHPLFLQGVMLDITERKDLERAVVEAVSREQAQTGQDLHDSICQRLTGIGFLWKVVAKKVAARSLPEVAEVAEIDQLITQTIGDARDLARGLCPVELEHNDLCLALKTLGSSMKRLFGVSCTVQCQQPLALADKTVATHLYRIAQEAVNNANRHGKAARVWMNLAWKKNVLTLRVRDNGSGFLKRRAFERGIGIRSMRYRAQAIGGSLTIESKRGVGTTVTCVCIQPTPPAEGIGHRSPRKKNRGFHDTDL